MTLIRNAECGLRNAPSPFPSPRWGEGGGEGKISNIFGWDLFGAWDLNANPLFGDSLPGTELSQP